MFANFTSGWTARTVADILDFLRVGNDADWPSLAKYHYFQSGLRDRCLNDQAIYWFDNNTDGMEGPGYRTLLLKRYLGKSPILGVAVVFPAPALKSAIFHIYAFITVKRDLPPWLKSI